MIKTRNYILSLSVMFIALSCKSQINNKISLKQEIVSPIKDSITCDKDIYKPYIFPYINLNNEAYSKNLNDKIKDDVKDYLDWFDTFDDSKTLKENLSFYIKTIEENCGKPPFSPLTDAYYNIEINRNNVLSLHIFIETYAGSINTNHYYYNFNLEKGIEFGLNDVFKENIKDFIPFINESIKKSIRIELEDESVSNKQILEIQSKHLIKELPNFFLRCNEEKIEGIEFIVYLNYSIKSLNPTQQIFFSFEELKPYLKEEFKEQLGL